MGANCDPGMDVFAGNKQNIIGTMRRSFDDRCIATHVFLLHCLLNLLNVNKNVFKQSNEYIKKCNQLEK